MKALQHPDELARFVELIRSEAVTSYLEIGCKFGGTFTAVTRAMPKKSRAVAVDLPAGSPHWPQSKVSLSACVEQLKRVGYDTHLIWGDSTDAAVIEKVRKLGPFDLVLIDGGHTLPFVTSDWMHYGTMAKIVAFHDIAWHRPADWSGEYWIDVPGFWQRVKVGYRYREIKLDPTGQDNGIGIVWRGEKRYAQSQQGSSQDDASGSTRPEVREEAGNSAERGEEVREGR
jgi:methyltransferase family protein